MGIVVVMTKYRTAARGGCEAGTDTAATTVVGGRPTADGARR